MRSVRFVLALKGTRDSLPARALLPRPRTWRALSSAGGEPPSNPFEIDLNVLKTPVSTEKLTLDNATRAAISQQAEAQHNIDLLHDEMSRLFGEEVAEYGGDTSSSKVEEAVAAFDTRAGAREQGDAVQPKGERGVRVADVEPPVTRANATSKRTKKMVPSVEGSVARSSPAPVDVVLLQGPCSFVRGIWTGGDVEKQDLHRQIQALADDLGIVVKDRYYFSEKVILQTLLESREDQVIVLCWNISLSKSPFVVHALGLIQTRVILVSPTNVEHGPLPANIVGVLSGFWNQSISLALNAAANLLESGRAQETAPQGRSNVKTQPSSAVIASTKEEGLAKKKVLTCYLCGEAGHIVRKCPKLPKNQD